MKTKLQYHSVPLLIGYLVILFVICLYPRTITIQHSEKKTEPLEKGTTLVPQEGDNVKIANEPAVFRIEQGKRRKYPSAESYLDSNPPFGTVYDSGGILIITKYTAQKFPVGKPMSDLPIAQKLLSKPSWEKKQDKPFSERFFRSDKLGHAFGYLILGLLLLAVLEKKTTLAYKKRLYYMFLIGTVLGILIEYLQATLTANRQAEFLDLFFNTLGLWLSVWVYKKWE